MNAWRRVVRPLMLLLAIGTLAMATGCATLAPGEKPTLQQVDPWENWNRKVYSFNEVVDEKVLVPAATAYRDHVPALVRTGVSNVFNNFRDVGSTLNHLLQGKLQSGLEMGMRVLTNTFFGLGGLLDPATEMRLERRPEDYGQTLGRWGVPPGPYVVLPFFGPASLRDSIVVPSDIFINPSPTLLVDGAWATAAVISLGVIDLRADLLSTGRFVDSIAIDKYTFLRDAYLARRLDQVFDGAPPMETFEDEPESAPTPAK